MMNTILATLAFLAIVRLSVRVKDYMLTIIALAALATILGYTAHNLADILSTHGTQQTPPAHPGRLSTPPKYET